MISIFILAWGCYLLSAPATPLPSAEHPQVLYISPYSHDLQALYRKAIRSAKTSIYLSSYGLTDNSIRNSLRAKVAEGIPVHVLSGKNPPPKGCHVLTSRVKGLLHEKILIIDDSNVFFSTANMTYPSLRVHENITLGVHDPLLAKSFKKTQTGTIIHAPSGTLCLLPEEDTQALSELTSLLRSAKKSIDVAMFTLTHPTLIGHLASSNTSVRVVTDRNTMRRYHTPLEGRVQYYTGKGLLHHKWALIDQEMFIIGSANWTRSAFQKNKDYVFICKLNNSNKILINEYFKKLIVKCN